MDDAPGPYRCGASIVDAMAFDGSASGARAICAWFPGAVAFLGDLLAITTKAGLVFAGAGAWIVRDRATRAVQAVEEQDFARFCAPIGDAPSAAVAPIEGRS